MNKSLLDFSDKIDPISIEIYQAICEIAIDTPWYVIGAQARDLYLEHKYDIKNLRRTRDFDLAIQVKDWEEFESLKTSLLENAEFKNSAEPHRLYFKSNIPVDIIPFGGLANKDRQITWPQDGTEMSVIGFQDVLQAAEFVVLRRDPDLQIRFATPAGLCVLKVIAWSDRPIERGKDIEDLYDIMTNYIHFDNWDRLDEEHSDLRDTNDFNEIYVGCQMLGRDIANITSEDTLNFLITILEAEISKGIGSALLPHLQRKFSDDNTNEPMIYIENLVEGLRFRNKK
ncbi:MAG: hypothetical protein R3A13_08585 [Bdellovibrionota bacterium]